jgi:beta-glucosidase-like glycosyl hydrolase
MVLAAIRDDNEAEKAVFDNGQITGKELAAIGITTCFTPVVDLCYEEGLPVKDNRYFGSDPVRAESWPRLLSADLNPPG